MKGNARLVDALNDILTAELTAINQYFIHARMCEKWGYLRLAQVNRDESIGEMKDAGDLIGRILEPSREFPTCSRSASSKSDTTRSSN
jgi:bacterioferritin